MPNNAPISEFNKKLCNRIYFSLPGLNDSQIGDLIGLKRQSVQGWRSGKSRPTLDQIQTISNISKISWRWFSTGKTTDYNSVGYSHLPIFYNKKIVKISSAYSLAREVAIQLIATQNEGLFLPALSLLLKMSKGDFNDTNIQNLVDNCICTYDFVDISHSDQYCLQSTPSDESIKLYLSMKESFIPLHVSKIPRRLEKYCYNESKDNTTYAYTTLNDSHFHNNKYKSSIADCNDYMKIKIIGGDLAPIINNNQEVTLSPAISTHSLVSHDPLIAVIKFSEKSSVYIKNNLNPSFRICRYISCLKGKVVLSDALNRTESYILDYEDIDEIHPIRAVLWN